MMSGGTPVWRAICTIWREMAHAIGGAAKRPVRQLSCANTTAVSGNASESQAQAGVARTIARSARALSHAL